MSAAAPTLARPGRPDPDGGVRGGERLPPAGAYSAAGDHNNDQFVVPERGLIFVRLGEDQSDYMSIAADHDGFFARLKVGMGWAE